MSVDSITALNLVDSARSLVGKPFVHQGRGSIGVDCIGLLSTAALGCGADLARMLGIEANNSYARNPSKALLEVTKATCKQVAEPIVGAALLFQLPGASDPHHFALYTEKDTIIHAEAVRAKCVVEQTYGKPWSRWLHSVWLIPGIEYT